MSLTYRYRARLPDPASFLTLGDETLSEGDASTTNMTFQLVRAADGYGDIEFDYETVAVTATPGVDYTHVSGSDVISSGETIDIDVPIIGDTDVESDETFQLRIFNIDWV